jgi:hypothetical protein
VIRGDCVEEERIKSAVEIAMERISSLPDLTPEEIAVQNEKKYAPVGEAIAGKYLRGLISGEEMLAEVEKQGGPEGTIVRRALFSGLGRMLNFEADSEQTSKAIAGLVRLTPGRESDIEAAATEFHSLVREFEQAERENLENFEASFLQPLGISGTAVRVNPAENFYWKEEVSHLLQKYAPKVEDLRADLLKIGDEGAPPRT